ncbi:hypothetical protein POM88_010012 [Heracleum sosnowskyi]|uniref:Pentatricopeptide repeat-containing protein n=1 Tax=Heracleum sosnowskyi TaxID=360622 RepID=A0AAD8J9U9_9APIA|nr:hypothetical protein POM88_010012 [Heracleum sosnowskyi]
MNLSNAHIEMYKKSGEMNDANQVFYEMEEKNVILSMTLIVKYGMHGDADTLLKHYEKMKYNALPRDKHHSCMADLFARRGQMEEAYDLILKMNTKRNASLWGAILGACSIYGERTLVVVQIRILDASIFGPEERVQHFCQQVELNELYSCGAVAYVVGLAVCCCLPLITEILYVLANQLQGPRISHEDHKQSGKKCILHVYCGNRKKRANVVYGVQCHKAAMISTLLLWIVLVANLVALVFIQFVWVKDGFFCGLWHSYRPLMNCCVVEI